MGWSRRALLAGVGASLGGVTGCLRPTPRGRSTGKLTPVPGGATFAYTHLRADGNRTLRSGGDIASATPIDVPIDQRPEWLLAFADGNRSLWVVVSGDRRASTYRLADGRAELVADLGPVPTPPIASMTAGKVSTVVVPAGASRLTNPVPAGRGWMYVTDTGDVAVWRPDGETRLRVDAPSDARIVSIDGRRFAVYGDRTDRYRHGALGDTTEGASLVVIDAERGRIESAVRLDPPTVFEGISPLVADIDGDGVGEVVTTIADPSDGARIRIYSIDGSEIATGPVHGPGWRHQLAIARFGPLETPEIAVVRKPHVDRTLEFYRLDGRDLRVTAALDGFASHTYGSRNLDGGLAVDIDADGEFELLVPATDRTSLRGVGRTSRGVTDEGTFPLGGPLTTNVTGVELDDGRVAVGAGSPGGLRVWQG